MFSWIFFFKFWTLNMIYRPSLVKKQEIGVSWVFSKDNKAKNLLKLGTEVRLPSEDFWAQFGVLNSLEKLYKLNFFIQKSAQHKTGFFQKF